MASQLEARQINGFLTSEFDTVFAADITYTVPCSPIAFEVFRRLILTSYRFPSLQRFNFPPRSGRS